MEGIGDSELRGTQPLGVKENLGFRAVDEDFVLRLSKLLNFLTHKLRFDEWVLGGVSLNGELVGGEGEKSQRRQKHDEDDYRIKS